MNGLGDAAVDLAGEIIVDDVHHIDNVQTASRKTSSNHDGAASRAESTTSCY